MKLILLTLLLIPSFAGATYQLKFNNLTKDEGLPSNMVKAFAFDSTGKVWVGTSSGLVSFNGYSIDKPYTLNNTKCHNLRLNINSLEFHEDLLYIASHNKGLLSFNIKSGVCTQLLDKNFEVLSISKGSAERLWIATNKGLFIKNLTNDLKLNSIISDIPNPEIIYHHNSKTFITSLNTLLITEEGKVLEEHSFSESITSLVKNNDSLWIGTSSGLFKLVNSKISKIDKLSAFSISSLAIYQGKLYIGTFSNGLIQYDLNKNIIHSLKHSPLNQYSISSNKIYSIAIDKNGNKFVGHFSQGFSFTAPSTPSLISYSSKSSPCLLGATIYSVLANLNNIYFGTDKGVIKLNLKSGHCSKINLNDSSIELAHIYRLTKNQKHEILASSQYGILKVQENSLHYLEEKEPRKLSYTAHSYNEDIYLIGKIDGVYYFNNKTFKEKKLNTDSFKAYDIKQLKDLYLIPSSKGLFSLKNNVLEKYIPQGKTLSNFDSPLLLIKGDDIWFQSKEMFLSRFNTVTNEISHFQYATSEPDNILLGITNYKDKLWLTSRNGLYSFNKKTNLFKKHTKKDGFLNHSYARNSIQKRGNKLLIVGFDGVNIFYPEDIKDNLVPPKVALTKLTRFNKEVVAGEDYEGFGISSPIEYLDKLEIGHRDYVMGFEFAGLHYADPTRNQYQFMLEGFHEDWVSTDAKNRTATFTNLKPGDYTFRVKASNKDGVWSLDEDNVALPITVHPAPWLSWWAYTIYGLVILGSLFWFIRHRTQSAIARSKELEQEVAARTKEIETQKNVIESLLERKNELFANISHEFRTPLTLILGPLEKELKALDSPKNPKHLQMIQRNANRLLGMVEQILKLTELKKEETINKVPHAVNPALKSIVDSFSDFAQSKDIQLSLQLDSNANIMAANDALEIMMGNLISNAIKYTPEGGEVRVSTKVLDNTIELQVTDNGVGMTESQQQDVFERFVRLDKTSDIAGTGIGLSIVKELILAHEGQVLLESSEGQGSTFTINLPTTSQAALSEPHSIKAIEHLTQNDATSTQGHVNNAEETGLTETQGTTKELPDTQQELVLIIDDNPDMREYIREVLAPGYHCLTSDRGEAGIELAKAQVPDLIICDIMMPGIDGYEVAKRLRDDIITSHIPLVLLTAKGDKESRIQGWNENIDDYMTKPFDEEELRARVGNILALRALIKTNLISKENNYPKKETQLTDKDKAFIEKLNSTLNKHYQNPLCTRSDLANDMAVSERQLQRKLKGLINQNPMDYLRNFRLEKGAELISTGKPINLISDLCGFNSASHFTQCFKAKYGVTPKKYGN